MAHYLLLMRPLRPLIAFLLLLPSSRCSTSSQVQVGIDGSTGSPAAPPAPPPGGAMDAVFENELNREVDVYWVENAAREVKIMSIPAGASKGINTFDAHAFFFSEVGHGKSRILKTVIMKHGQRTYAVTGADAAQGPRAAVAPGEHSADPRDACQDRKPHCHVSAARGECDRNPGWMVVNCPASCNACDLRDPEVRCDRKRLNVSDEPTYAPGDMSAMFRGLAETHPELGVNVLSTEPWVVTFDTFMNASEADAIYEAVGKDFVRSTDTGAYNKFGEAEKVVSQGRTSQNAWCREGCDSNPLVRGVIARIEKVLSIPYGNFEQFQVLRYEPGQYYRTHHDFGASQRKLACGPRILTFFLYLSDVEEGGETNFPRMGLKVPPAKGKALLWPSVLDEDLTRQETKTFHEALPVVKGLKIAANAWIHLYNFHVPNHWGCTGAFD